MRFAAWGLLLVVGLYVTIPWWAPTGWIRQHVESKLSRQAGTAVTIQELSLNWDEIRLEGLSVASRDTSAEPLVVAEYVRLPLEPINILLGRDVDWMEVEGLTLNARFRPGGGHNLDPLAELDLASQPRRVSLRDATIHLHLPDRPRPLQLTVSDLQFVAGRQHRLGELTLSARLEQEDQADAPVSFRLTRAPGDPSTIAAATFLFDGVDLAAMDLTGLLKLPLTRLEGHMQGELEFRMNPQGKVDRAAMEVAIRQLNAQPRGGPELEVIDQAGVKVAASWDPFAERIHLRTIELELPGSIRLAGRANLKATWPEPWEAIESLELTGMVNPSRLVALLTGEGGLGDGWRVDGPVEWRIRARHRDRIMCVEELALDAGAVRIRHRDRILKDTDHPLTFTMAGVLDDRTWRAELNDLRIRWDGLSVDGNAAWADVRALRGLAETAGDHALAAIVLENARCDLRVQADRLDGLARLGGPARRLADAAKLTGRLTGRARLDASRSPGLHLTLQADRPTRLAVGECFRKPAGEKLAVSLRADVHTDPNRGVLALNNVLGSLRVGDGQAVIRDGRLEWPTISGRASLRTSGSESLLKCWPGETSGEWNVTDKLALDVTFRDLSEPVLRAWRMEATLTGAGIRAGPWFTKPTGETLSVQAIAGGRTSRAWLTGEHIEANAWTTASMEELFTDPNVPLGVEWDTDDANALVARSPWLQKQLADWSIQGPVRMAGRLQRGDGQTQLELGADATEAHIQQRAKPRRTKPAGVRLRLGLAMADRPAGDRGRKLTVTRLAATLAKMEMLASGEIAYDPDANQPQGVRWPIAALQTVDANVALIGQPTGLEVLLPELADALKPISTTDDVRLRTRVRLGEAGVSLQGRFDAGEGRVRVGEVVKPASLRLRASLGLRGRRDLTEWTLAEGHAELIDPAGRNGEQILARFLLDAAVRGQLGRDGLPRWASFRPTAWHAWMASDHAGRLADVWPKAKGRLTGGAVRIEAENRSGRWGRIDMARISAEGVTGTYRGRKVTLDGELQASDVGWSPRGGWSVGSLKVTDLEAVAGPNHAWVIAELAGLPDRPTGRVRLLADTLDDADLVNWLAAPAPQDPNAVELTDRQVAELRRTAAELIAQLRGPVSKMDVALEADVETLRTTDVSVDQTYDMKHLRADLAVRRGRVDADIAAILNGGSYRTSVRADAAASDQPVRMQFHLLKVVGTPEIQPQLAKYFPGNTVEGLFTRDEELRETLTGSLAYFLDHRYPWTPVGSARTVATDGYIVGRAVPEWMTTIFPQLNLQRYEYETMTGFATYRASGLAENDMIFSGQQYDVYMEGTTDAENRARYKVGLLLKTGSPEWHHAWGAGRLPLLMVKGTIHGGELLNREVSFLWPNEAIMAIANPIYRAFINRKKE